MISLQAVLSLVLPLVGAAVVAPLLIWNFRRRRAALAQRAAEAAAAGWVLAPPNPWLEEVAAGLYTHGEATEMYAGDYRGRGMCVFDYTYTTSSGKTQQTHTVHLVALNLPASLPPLTLMHDSGLRRALRGRDLQLENEQFNERFRVECADDRYGSAVMHPRMMECVLQNPGLEWQIAGNALVSWGTGGFAVPDVLARLEAMSRLIDLIPSFVLRDYGQPTFR
ncbi:DUF3137 domain-containing protein [Kribbella sp. NPDC051586]|uniref:DUF3137 domain-containing protein n=1 Tax=Kribbella sp. NPDC051586 TaxID=3364118 RepID=UPI003795CE02